MGTLGERVRQERDRLLLTQQELSDLSGVTTVTISRIENGRGARRPTRATLKALADALGVDVYWLANGEELLEGKLAA
ncbi:MAG: helix-turn-helix transcriptional regulator [Thermomicrobiales bacterium]